MIMLRGWRCVHSHICGCFNSSVVAIISDIWRWRRPRGRSVLGSLQRGFCWNCRSNQRIAKPFWQGLEFLTRNTERFKVPCMLSDLASVGKGTYQSYGTRTTHRLRIADQKARSCAQPERAKHHHLNELALTYFPHFCERLVAAWG